MHSMNRFFMVLIKNIDEMGNNVVNSETYPSLVGYWGKEKFASTFKWITQLVAP